MDPYIARLFKHTVLYGGGRMLQALSIYVVLLFAS
jgi:hypothetical protein